MCDNWLRDRRVSDSVRGLFSAIRTACLHVQECAALWAGDRWCWPVARYPYSLSTGQASDDTAYKYHVLSKIRGAVLTRSLFL